MQGKVNSDLTFNVVYLTNFKALGRQTNLRIKGTLMIIALPAEPIWGCIQFIPE